MDVCPELVVKVSASTSKVADIVEEVNRTLWGKVHRKTREASCGVGGLKPPPLQTYTYFPSKGRNYGKQILVSPSAPLWLLLSFTAPYLLVTTLSCVSSCIFFI